MKRYPITGKAVGLMILLIVLSGCWDQISVENLSFVTAVGLDRDEENENMVEVTYVIANPESGTLATGGDTSESPIETISFTAEDFNTAKSIANIVISKQISYDLLRVFMVSEEFASDEDFLRWIYDVTKSPEVRRDINLLITKEDVLTFVENNEPKLETRSHKFYELMFESGQQTGTIPPSKMNQYFQITEENANLFLAMYATTEQNETEERLEDSDQFIAGELNYEGETNTAEFAGSAVFNEGKMIDTLTVEETRLSYLLNNVLEQPESMIVSLSDPEEEGGQVAARVKRQGKVQLDMDLKGSTPSIHATVPLNLDILTNHSMENVAENKEARENLKKEFEQTFDQKFAELVKKTQEELGGQPFSWSLPARKKFLTLSEFNDYDWKNTYPEMEVTVETDVTFESFGRQAKVPDLEEVRD
jgi:Ger(x)C family germination protein